MPSVAPYDCSNAGDTNNRPGLRSGYVYFYAFDGVLVALCIANIYRCQRNGMHSEITYKHAVEVRARGVSKLMAYGEEVRYPYAYETFCLPV
jgi:hypothetical protein